MMRPLHIAMLFTLVVVMALIGWAAKWGINNIGLWIVVPALALIFWIARQIDKSDARKAKGQQRPHSQPPESPGQ